MATKRSGNSLPLSHRFSQKKNTQQRTKPLKESHGIAPPSAPKPQDVELSSDAAIGLNDQHDDLEEALRQFDMDLRYGPCLGLKRLERWERAHRLGMQPPAHVKEIIERVSGTPTCIWEGRV